MFDDGDSPEPSPRNSTGHIPDLKSLIPEPNPISNFAPDPTSEWSFGKPGLPASLKPTPVTRTITPQTKTECPFKEFNERTRIFEKEVSKDHRFDSEFESGNLHMVVQNGEKAYLCLKEKDTNSQAHGSWFYFKACLVGTVRFTIIPFRSKQNLYRQGMHICVFSHDKWRRGGTDIQYSPFREIDDIQYFSLSFTYDFGREQDTVFFAYAFPYTLTKLNKFLTGITHKGLKCRQFCTSVQNRPIYVVRIGEGRKKIIISARVHPCQTVSSYMCQGIIRFLLSDQIEARKLKENYEFVIIPMLNPDGVCVGNSRFSFLGFDLNRKWISPMAMLHPEIYHYRKFIQQFSKNQEIFYLFDLHGHSRKTHFFCYGYLESPFSNVRTKRLPYFIHDYSDMFNFRHCNFKVSPDKEGTLRVAISRMMEAYKKKTMIYTVEASFFGHSREWGLEDYLGLGTTLMQSLHNIKKIKPQNWQEIQSNELFLEAGMNDDSSGSDSCPSFGEQSQEMYTDLIEKDKPVTVDFKKQDDEVKYSSRGRQKSRYLKLQSKSKQRNFYTRVTDRVRKNEQSNQKSKSLQTEKKKEPVQKRDKSFKPARQISYQLQEDNSKKKQSIRTRKITHYVKNRMNLPTVYFGEVQKGIRCQISKNGEMDTLLQESGLQRGKEVFIPKGYNINKLRMIYYRKDISKCWKRPSPSN